MNKTQLIELGIKEDKVKEFQAAYWADVRKVAKQEAKAMTQEERNEADDLVNAIRGVLRMLDPHKLTTVLAFAVDLYVKQAMSHNQTPAPGGSYVVGDDVK